MKLDSNKVVEVSCIVTKQRDAAWLVYFQGKEIWVPTSRIEDHSTTIIDGVETVTSIFIPDWLATEKGFIA